MMQLPMARARRFAVVIIHFFNTFGGRRYDAVIDKDDHVFSRLNFVVSVVSYIGLTAFAGR